MIKTFERWTSTTTDDIAINYGDKKSEFSEIVQHTEEFIKDHFKYINSIDINNMIINFTDYDIVGFINISLAKTSSLHPIYSINFRKMRHNYDYQINITKEEYTHLCDFFYDTIIKRNKSYEPLDEILDEIDPVRKTGKKYNL